MTEIFLSLHPRTTAFPYQTRLLGGHFDGRDCRHISSQVLQIKLPEASKRLHDASILLAIVERVDCFDPVRE